MILISVNLGFVILCVLVTTELGYICGIFILKCKDTFVVYSS